MAAPAAAGAVVGVLFGSPWAAGAVAGTLLASTYAWRNYFGPARVPRELRPPRR